MEISLRAAHARVLARHGLSGPGAKSGHDAVTAAAGVFGSAPPCYLSCAARVPGFRLPDLDEELYARRRLVRMRCMRGMAYVVPAADAPLLVAATRPGEPRHIAQVLKNAGLTEADYDRWADHVETALEGRAASVAELRELLAGQGHEPPRALGQVLAIMGRTMRVVRAHVRGTWRSDAYAYARWEEWTGVPMTAVDPAAARAELARRYLAAYGPATAADLKWWAGWTVRDTKAALAALGEEAVPVRLSGTDAYALETTSGDLDTDPPEGVRLLPYWDTLMMAYAPAGRAPRLVAEADRPRVYDKVGNGTSVVLIDGRPRGVWDFDHDEDALTVRVAPFGDVPRAAVEEAVARLGDVLGVTGPRLVWAPEPGALDDGPRNAFLAPIRLTV